VSRNKQAAASFNLGYTGTRVKYAQIVLFTHENHATLAINFGNAVMVIISDKHGMLDQAQS